MTSDTLERVRDLFFETVELEPAQRDAVVGRAAAEHPRVADMLRRLLLAHDRQGPLDELASALDPVRGAGSRPVDRSFEERYQVLRTLGRGAMGVVELAHDRMLDRLVALKRLSLPVDLPELHATRITEEARAAARISHPYIATVYSIETDPEGLTVLSMEYCPGESLRECLARGPLGREEALEIAALVAEALAAAHQQGVVHRDVKPANILMAGDGAVRLVDFGISLTRVEGRSGTRYVAGTPGYMAPEQASGSEVDGRTDLWSLGVVLREMLTGSSARAHSEPVTGAADVGGKAGIDDPEVARVLARLLAEDPAARYPDGHALAADLRALVSKDGGWTVGLEPVPAPLDDFIGRENEVNRIIGEIAASRLVTVVGPGGVGKTRIVSEIAHQEWEGKPGVGVFVPLAAVHAPGSVLPLVASYLRVPTRPDVPIRDAIRAAIGQVDMLIILDNFEHVLKAAEDVLDLMHVCPRLRVLVTSRERLRLRGERDVRLEPLACASSTVDEPAGTESPAARLFHVRAPRLVANEPLDREQLSLVEEICKAVDGLPLGIELAASATRTHELEAVAHGLRHLWDDALDRPERHRTLERVARWSFELLEEPVRHSWLQVSTFVDPFSAADAACVCDRAEADVAAHLENLVDRSLLRIVGDDDGQPLFGFLTTLRSFALAERDRRLDRGSLCDRHLARFADLGALARGELQGAEQVRWLDRIERSVGDLGEALRWSVEAADPDLGIALMLDLWRFWLARGRAYEARELVEGLLDSEEMKTTDRAQLLNVLASFERNSGAEDAAMHHLEESLTLFREVGDESRSVDLFNQLSWSYIMKTDLATAEDYAAEAIRLSQRSESPRAIALGHNNLGWIANFRDRGSVGRNHHERSLAIVRRAADPRAIVYGLTNLAWSYLIEDRPEEAMEALAEARRLWRDVRDPLMEGWLSTILGLALDRFGRTEEAIDTLLRAVARGERFRVGPGLAWALVALGQVQRTSGRDVAAADTLLHGIDVAERANSDWAVARCRMELAMLPSVSNDEATRYAHLVAAIDVWTRIRNERRLDECHGLLKSASPSDRHPDASG